MSPEQLHSLAAFQGKQIRRQLVNGEWFFSIVDVITILSESSNARRYWSDLKTKLEQSEGFIQLYEKIVQLKLPAADGKLYETDCADAKIMLRIIQSVPSPKAEPLKQWLAQVGYERIQEIENPELAMQRVQETYRIKGYPEDWIQKRMRGIAVREELTTEWKNRGTSEGQEFAILTAEISRATFDITPSEHKKLKSLKRQNLRDHMTDLELIFTMLGEASTTAITRSRDSQGMLALHSAAKEGGKVAGTARRQLEQETGKKVVSTENYLAVVDAPKQVASRKKED